MIRSSWIESMCVICHGPVPLKAGGRRTSTTCHENCRSHLREVREGKPLSPKYEFLRMRHAQRRELELVLMKVATLARVLERLDEIDAEFIAGPRTPQRPVPRRRQQPASGLARVLPRARH